jgi:hypothetical protein
VGLPQAMSVSSNPSNLSLSVGTLEFITHNPILNNMKSNQFDVVNGMVSRIYDGLYLYNVSDCELNHNESGYAEGASL